MTIFVRSMAQPYRGNFLGIPRTFDVNLRRLLRLGRPNLCNCSRGLIGQFYVYFNSLPVWPLQLCPDETSA